MGAKMCVSNSSPCSPSLEELSVGMYPEASSTSSAKLREDDLVVCKDDNDVRPPFAALPIVEAEEVFDFEKAAVEVADAALAAVMKAMAASPEGFAAKAAVRKELATTAKAAPLSADSVKAARLAALAPKAPSKETPAKAAEPSKASPSADKSAEPALVEEPKPKPKAKSKPKPKPKAEPEPAFVPKKKAKFTQSQAKKFVDYAVRKLDEKDNKARFMAAIKVLKEKHKAEAAFQFAAMNELPDIGWEILGVEMSKYGFERRNMLVGLLQINGFAQDDPDLEKKLGKLQAAFEGDELKLSGQPDKNGRVR